MDKKTPAVKFSPDRIFALVLAAVSVIALFLPYKVISGTADGNFTASAKFLFLGFGGNMSGVGLLSLLAVIVMLATAVASAVISILAIVNSDYAPTLIRVSSLVLSTGAGMYSLSVFALSMYQSNLATAFDFVSLIISIIGLSIFAVLSIRKHGKFMSKPAGQYIAILVSTVFLVLSVAASGRTANIVVIALIALAWFSLVFSQVCVMYSFDSALLHRIRLIAHLGIAFVLCLVCLFSLGGRAFLFSFLGTLAAALPVAENFLNVNEDEENEETPAEESAYTEYSASEEEYGDNEPEPEMFPSIPRSQMIAQEEPLPQEPLENPFVKEPVKETVKAYTVEEYAEAYAYEGGPVQGVELAQEVNPSFNPYTPANTNSYDFYNCQSFDAFIASLTNEERNQFTELFILRYKGVMPEIPDYVVGGDNREFFRKIFIYLGQYRERIPNDLLNKMYIYSTKVY